LIKYTGFLIRFFLPVNSLRLIGGFFFQKACIDNQNEWFPASSDLLQQRLAYNHLVLASCAWNAIANAAMERMMHIWVQLLDIRRQQVPQLTSSSMEALHLQCAFQLFFLSRVLLMGVLRGNR
jgi:hypothetical protein